MPVKGQESPGGAFYECSRGNEENYAFTAAGDTQKGERKAEAIITQLRILQTNEGLAVKQSIFYNLEVVQS